MSSASFHHFDPSIIRAYDIRGVVGQSLTALDAYHIGRTFSAWLISHLALSASASPTIAVARDGRLHSPEMEEALIKGFSESGVQAIVLGVGPTPMLYYAVKALDLDGGVMITGSHNPAEHNGFKLVSRHGALYGDDITALSGIAATGAYPQGTGSVREEPEIKARYLERLLQDCTLAPDSGLRIAWDAGNGAAGEITARLCERLPGTHFPLLTEIDGRFPVHHPDPSVEGNLTLLKETVQKEQCDAGIAFDGDGDRIGVIDSKGRVLWGDQLLMIFAESVLRDHPGATVIADVKASQLLFDHVAGLGGAPLMWKTGHSLIKAKMAKTGAVLAGEMSGHMFFADHYEGFDDGLYAAVRLLNWLQESSRTLSEWRDAQPNLMNTPELRISCPEEQKFAVVEAVARRLEAQGARVSAVDGVRVQTEDGWWLLRASNTQPALVARCESPTPEGLTSLTEILRSQLARSGITLEM